MFFSRKSSFVFLNIHELELTFKCFDFHRAKVLCMLVTALSKAVEEFSKAVGNLLFLVIFDAVSVVLSGLFLYYSSNINLFQVNP